MSRPIKITEIVIKRLPTTCDLMASQANSTKYLEELTTILLKLFQNMAEEGKLPNSFYEATIALIPKPKIPPKKREREKSGSSSIYSLN